MNLFSDDIFTKRAITTSIVCACLLFLIPALFWGKLASEVPLFYSLLWGESQIVNKIFLFVPGIATLMFFAVNATLVRILKTSNEKDLLLKRFLWGGCALSSILALITIVRIILLF